MWYGHWRIGQKRLLKKTGKNPSLWDRGVATSGPG